MKNLILIVLGAAVGFGIGYVVVSNNSHAPSAVPGNQPTANSAPAGNSAVDILQKLAALDPNDAPNRPRAARQIIFYLETLVNDGNAAVKPISDFFATGKDMDYVMPEKTASSVTFWDWHPGQPVYSGLVMPPTLRLSLVDVLRYIGGADAENALVSLLQSSTRPVEMAYVGEMLEKMAPGKYTALVNAMAKKLLADLGTNSAPLDDHSESYLYAVLNGGGSTDAVAAAESKVVSGGKVDFDAAQYLLSTLKQGALPELSQDYTNADYEGKNKIESLTYSYIGTSPLADSIFEDWVLNNTQSNSSDISGRARFMAIQMLAGGGVGPFSQPPPTDPNTIADLISMLDDLNGKTADPNVKRAIAATLPNLQHLLNSAQGRH